MKGESTMSFDRDELVLLSRLGRVPHTRRGDAYRESWRSRETHARYVAESRQRRIAGRRALRARILAVWTVLSSDA
jgi:hypothetical protein